MGSALRRNPNVGNLPRFSRRQFLAGVASSVVAARLSPLAFAASASPYAFEEIPASVSGITWRHVSGASPEKYLPETTGAGCAFLDYDNDGWMDIYLVNSGKADFFTPAKPLRNALYRNNRDGTFTDVTEKAGVEGGGYGQGVAVGDYDGDGFPDLYVTQYGRSILYHNNGDGTFTDVTEKAGVAAPGWASSAVWFDYDNDGRLDLFVCQFVEFSKSLNKPCGLQDDGRHHYCIPHLYRSMPSWLFHNNGDGTFTDVSKQVGIAARPGKGWGVVAADINNDGWMDLFVSNDTEPNFLWVNRKGQRFEEIGTQAGVGYSSEGHPRSGMGVDAADFNQDGFIDLFVTNVDREMYSLYNNNGDETFDDLAQTSSLGPTTELMSGWGLKFFDYDNDGNLDLIIANGNPDDLVQTLHPEVKYKLPLLMFRGDGKTFRNISDQCGPAFEQDISARGLALGDFNNDGALDVLVQVNNGAPILLKNNAARGHHWLGLKLEGRKSNPDAIGATITYKAGDLKRTVAKVGGGSFLSAHDPRVILGLGTRDKIDLLEIRWPGRSHEVERFTALPVDRYITIVEGEVKWK